MWLPICSTSFNNEEAQAACRQLGFVDGSKSYNIIVTMSPVTTNINLLIICNQCLLKL